MSQSHYHLAILNLRAALTLPLLRNGSLPLPRCGRGACVPTWRHYYADETLLAALHQNDDFLRGVADLGGLELARRRRAVVVDIVRVEEVARDGRPQGHAGALGGVRARLGRRPFAQNADDMPGRIEGGRAAALGADRRAHLPDAVVVASAREGV